MNFTRRTKGILSQIFLLALLARTTVTSLAASDIAIVAQNQDNSTNIQVNGIVHNILFPLAVCPTFQATKKEYPCPWFPSAMCTIHIIQCYLPKVYVRMF